MPGFYFLDELLGVLLANNTISSWVFEENCCMTPWADSHVLELTVWRGAVWRQRCLQYRQHLHEIRQTHIHYGQTLRQLYKVNTHFFTNKQCLSRQAWQVSVWWYHGNTTIGGMAVEKQPSLDKDTEQQIGLEKTKAKEEMTIRSQWTN